MFLSRETKHQAGCTPSPKSSRMENRIMIGGPQMKAVALVKSISWDAVRQREVTTPT